METILRFNVIARNGETQVRDMKLDESMSKYYHEQIVPKREMAVAVKTGAEKLGMDLKELSLAVGIPYAEIMNIMCGKGFKLLYVRKVFHFLNITDFPYDVTKLESNSAIIK